MNEQAKGSISATKATALLNAGLPLSDVYVDGEIRIEGEDAWDKEVVIENCMIESFLGISTQFEKPVRFKNAHFKRCDFAFAYFFGGLTIDNCAFENMLDFQAGGHNKAGNPIIITNNDFAGFVNFFDCWYENEVVISNNNFQKGTNLLGKPHRVRVTFDLEPVIKDNTGRLDWDDEGGWPEQ